MLTFELRIREIGGDVVASNVNTFIFPRGKDEEEGT
jgi:hypothetical protein